VKAQIRELGKALGSVGQELSIHLTTHSTEQTE
jgi:hypothetical protein